MSTEQPGTNNIKLFTSVIYECLRYVGVFVPGKPLQPSQMFAGKAGVYPSAQLLGRLLALPKSIGLGWKGLPEPSTIAYYEHL
jgi:hypothetical protein